MFHCTLIDEIILTEYYDTQQVQSDIKQIYEYHL